MWHRYGENPDNGAECKAPDRPDMLQSNMFSYRAMTSARVDGIPMLHVRHGRAQDDVAEAKAASSMPPALQAKDRSIEV
jgi:hypothetical protein